MDESSYLDSSIMTAGNVKITLGEKEYFVLGDNRPVSFDSRRWGVVPRSDIIGRVYFKAWPVEDIALIESPQY